MSFADKVAHIVDMHEWEREYYEWLKQPPWVRYADTNDRLPGFDEEPGKPVTYPTHKELEKLTGRKLIDLDKEGLPY